MGSLFRLQLPAPHNLFFFVGTAVKKPQVHVLIQGFPGFPSADADVDKVSILDPTSRQPAFCLSQQMFQSVLASDGLNDLKTIGFAVHEYKVNPFEPLHTVILTGAASKCEFSIGNIAVPKQQTRLPFGLKPKRSPRKRKNGQQECPANSCDRDCHDLEGPSKKSKNKLHAAACEQHVTGDVPTDLNSIERELQQQYQQQHEDSKCDSDGATTSNSSSSGSSTSSSTSSGEEDDCGAIGALFDDADAVERPFLSPEAMEEERQLQLVLQSHANLAQSRGEILGRKGGGDLSETEAQAGKEHRQSSKAATFQVANPPSTGGTPTPTQRTFCNPEVGLVEGGIQTSKKLATCRECFSKIGLNQVRFGYAYSRSKFHSWVHSGCLLKYLKKQAANLHQAIQWFERDHGFPRK